LKILLIEDSPEIVKGVSLTFKLRWPDAVIISAENGADGIKRVEDDSPDILILDINLPDMSGFDVLEHIRQFSEVPVIILSARDQEIDKVRGLEIGADDYIVKPFSPSELLVRCQAVLRRTGIHSPGESELRPIKSGNIYLNLNTNEFIVDNEKIHLTPNERRILYYLASNENKVVTQDAIKQYVWGNEAKYLDNTSLKRYIYQLRLKLGDNANEPKLILNERGIGYRFVKPS
jgi:two-component system KDP operon response regulator KdpE